MFFDDLPNLGMPCKILTATLSDNFSNLLGSMKARNKNPVVPTNPDQEASAPVE